MKIEIERSGGFAGIINSVIVDTKMLPSDVARTIERRLAQEPPAPRQAREVSKKYIPPDCYYYKISCRMGREKRKIEFNEFDEEKGLVLLANKLLKNNGRI